MCTFSVIGRKLQMEGDAVLSGLLETGCPSAALKFPAVME